MKSQLLNINLKEIPQEKRYELFKLAVEKYGLKPKDLGISSNYMCKIKTGQRKPSINLCQKLITIISNYAALPARHPCEAFRTSRG